MSATLSKKVGRYSFRRMRGMALRTPTVNSFYSGLSHLLGWNVFFEK